MSTDLQAAQAFFLDQGLPFPAIPDRFQATFRALEERVWGTRPYNISLYAVGSLVQEVLEGPVPDYVLMGFDGHGINSWAVHYFLVDGPLVVFLQIHWGGAYTNTDRSRARFAAALGDVQTLEAHLVRRRHHLPEGWRLLVTLSDFSSDNGYGWIDPAWTGMPVDWRRTRDLPFAAALAEVDDVALGKRAITGQPHG